MDEESVRLDQLLEKLNDLMIRQEVFAKEIRDIQHEIYLIKKSLSEQKIPAQPEPSLDYNQTKYQVKPVLEEPEAETSIQKERITEQSNQILTNRSGRAKQTTRDLEKYIGENLISKIGIAVTVIGVSIGVKYSIDHQLISPLMRILLGYLAGFILLGIGLKLKTKYKNYSAVLVSGSMAILYFMTYAAYSFYQLLPQTVTFGMMVLVTIATVFFALKYNKEVIAHFGLVGAYAVPFLLSENSGNVTVLYSYMAIINVGILVISFLKYWKPLYVSAFIITWLMYFAWYMESYKTSDHFNVAMVFLTFFFLIFYISFLAYKLRKNTIFGIEEIVLLLANVFIFYGIGYSILEGNETSKQYLGTFTLANAGIHLLAGLVIYREKLKDKNLFYLVLGLILLFITVAIPVQLDGNWVTILWAGEALLLFWIGRTKGSTIYEILSYPLMALAFVSLLQDWGTGPYLNEPKTIVMPLLNIQFLDSGLFLAFFGTIVFLNQNKKYKISVALKSQIREIIDAAIPVIFLVALYYTFRLEIASWFQKQYINSAIDISTDANMHQLTYNTNLLKFKTLWIGNYSMLWLCLLSIVNIKKIKDQRLGLVNLGLNLIALAFFLIQNLYVFGELRDAYLQKTTDVNFPVSSMNVGIRYVSLAFVAALIFTSYRYIRQEFLKNNLRFEFDLVLHISVLWIASSELINWMDIWGSSQSDKLGLSILWGIYSLMLISLGIWKKKKYLRIGAIALFAVTLLKLFFYDLSYLDTISKTIVFVSLGLFLLIISFLYNKYKNLIS